MIRLDDFSEYPFSSADLYVICEKYAARLVASADDVQLDFEPSESSRAIIRCLIDRSLQKARRHTLFRRVAAVALVIVLVFSTIMATNIHAREMIVHWLRQLFPDHVQYQFFGETTDEIYHYTIGWIPEGFELVEFNDDEKEQYYIYENDIDGLIIEFVRFTSYHQLEIEGYSSQEDIFLDPFEGTMYIDPIKSNVLVLLDESKRYVISINSSLAPEIIIDIAKTIY